jgi:hypothetical protein
MPRIYSRKPKPAQDLLVPADHPGKTDGCETIPRYSAAASKPTLTKRPPVLGYGVLNANNMVIVSLETLRRAGITAEIGEQTADGGRSILLRVVVPPPR